MVTKKVACPKCKNEITISGEPGEKIIIDCPNCKIKGQFTFPAEKKETKDKSQSIKKEGYDGEYTIQITNLVKHFKNVKAVDDVSFNVRKGEIFGFLGPNGAGKTTTIKAMLNLIHPNSGKIIINGIDMKTNGIKIKEKIGYLPERVSFYENLTPIQTLEFFCELKGADKSSIKPLLRDVGLEEAMNRKVGTFSKGMVQLLGLAQVLIGNSRIYILDEPTSGLDARWVKIVREKIRALKEDGATVIFSSHILSEVQTLCDRVGIINKGKMVAEDTVKNISKILNIRPRLSIFIKDLNNQVPESIKNLEGVEEVEAKKDILLITCEPTIRSKVIIALEKQGYEIIDIQTIEPSLEEAFVKLVDGGKQ
jgi:ABC-2 type transport system ATP-binding protein